MENASKAIIMAGGVLIAMITISIFYFVFGQTSLIVGVTEEDTNQKQLIAFNKSFEAYNKRLMYGADIISVLNKAINNNKEYEVEDYQDPKEPRHLDFYVDVEFTVYTGSARGPGAPTKTYSLSKNYGKGTDNKIKIDYLDRMNIKKGDSR